MEQLFILKNPYPYIMFPSIVVFVRLITFNHRVQKCRQKLKLYKMNIMSQKLFTKKLA